MAARHALVAQRIKALRVVRDNPPEVWGIEPDRGPWACPDCGASADELCYANCLRYREDPS